MTTVKIQSQVHQAPCCLAASCRRSDQETPQCWRWRQADVRLKFRRRGGSEAQQRPRRQVNTGRGTVPGIGASPTGKTPRSKRPRDVAVVNRLAARRLTEVFFPIGRSIERIARSERRETVTRPQRGERRDSGCCLRRTSRMYRCRPCCQGCALPELLDWLRLE